MPINRIKDTHTWTEPYKTGALVNGFPVSHIWSHNWQMINGWKSLLQISS